MGDSEKKQELSVEQDQDSIEEAIPEELKMNTDETETPHGITEETAQFFIITQRKELVKMETEDCDPTVKESSSPISSSDDYSSDEDDPAIPNKRYLRENLEMLKNTLSDTDGATDTLDLHLEPQIELELNQLAIVNIVRWIQKKLKGEDPSTTPLKPLLDRIKEAMLVFHEGKEGGRRPRTVKTIEALFQHVYEL